MTFRDLITQEAADIRAKAQEALLKAHDDANQLIAKAQADVTQAETDAQALEAKLTSLPAELEGLIEESAKSVWSWVKSL